MNDKYKVLVRNIDLTNVRSMLDYFRLLKLYIPSDELIHGVLKVSYSAYYKFNANAKKGILTQGKVLKQLYKLYTYTLSGVYHE